MRLDEQRRRAYLDAIGIDLWLPRGEAGVPQSETGADGGPADDVGALDWGSLRERVSGCQRCELAATRTQTVFGVGHPRARWMIVGEAPGAEEDRRGEPFVANTLKCRPPNNRDPRADEAAACRPYLDRQIELLAPDIILAVGRIAAQNLLGSDLPVGRLRGQPHELGKIPLVVTYHPAYLLRSPGQKRKVWQDLCLARRVSREVAA